MIEGDFTFTHATLADYIDKVRACWEANRLNANDAEIARLRAGLEKIIECDQIGGVPPPDAILRRVPGLNIDTWDGESAALARRILEQ